MLELSKRDYKIIITKVEKIDHMYEEMRNFSGEMNSEKKLKENDINIKYNQK